MVKKFPKRGEIYWVNFNPAVGAEIQKLRPGLIISNDIGNEESNVVIVAPITSNVKKIYPFEVYMVLNKPGKVMINQCRAIDKSRLKEKIGEAESETMQAVDEAIKIVFSIS